MIITVYNGIYLPSWISGKIARLVYVGILSFLIVVYVCQVNSASSIGYEMRDLQRQNDKLKHDIRNLNVQVASYSALPNLEKRISQINLSKVTHINYVNIPEVQMAKR